MATVEPLSLPFREAIDFFRQKVNLPTRTWTDLWQGMHARAFVVAGAARDGLVSDFREAVAKAIEQGTTLADFRKDFDRIVAEHGWSYNGGRGWRTGVIFNTNLRTAYAAGRWAQIQRLKEARPYLRYVAVLDDRTRPEHRDWHGTVLPADDGWWKTHYPPNGWNCRCTVQQLSERDLGRLGLEVSDPPPVEFETRTINTPSGPVAIEVPKGIDPGFGYNVGEAAWGRGEQSVAMERHGEWAALESPGGSTPAPGRLPVDAPDAAPGPRAAPGDAAALYGLLRRALGADAATLTDPTGELVRITPALIDHMLAAPGRQDGREAFFPFIPGLVQKPAEIWMGFAKSSESGRVALRRRYVKLIQLDDARVLALVADSEDGMWTGFTFFRGRAGSAESLRTGVLAYSR